MLCNKCKKSFRPEKDLYEKLKETYGPEWFEKHKMKSFSDKLSLKEKNGCKACDQIGYRGRTAIFELLVNTEQIKRGIKEKMPTEEIRAMALENGMRTLRMDGVDKIFQGKTDLSEIVRVC
jgi:type II secretory ATPase GspE/PulE/Tfp pilus assembly ATPase PilB-like protein